MGDEQNKPHAWRSLDVVNNTDKVQELRDAYESDRAAGKERKLADQTPIDRAVDSSLSPEQKQLREKVIEQLKTVYDPEIPVDVYELGLIYGIDVSEDARVTITMTLTAPACPVADQIVREVQSKVDELDAVTSTTVDLTFDPPWTKERMSEAAMLELDLL